jgi:hypothetical protein
MEGRGSSVRTPTGYGLDGLGSVPGQGQDSVRTGSRARPASYPTDTGGSFPVREATAA